MKNRLYFLMLAITILSIGTSSVQSVQPLYGTADTQFNLGFPGPQDEIPDWVGHININGVNYGIVFYNLGTGKSLNNKADVNTVFFTEQWVVFSSIDIHFNDQGVLTDWSHGSIVMSGDDTGVVSIANSHYVMNGEVRVANGIFNIYQGHTVHISGTVQWYDFGAPQFAHGPFRIN